MITARKLRELQQKSVETPPEEDEYIPPTAEEVLRDVEHAARERAMGRCSTMNWPPYPKPHVWTTKECQDAELRAAVVAKNLRAAGWHVRVHALPIHDDQDENTGRLIYSGNVGISFSFSWTEKDSLG